MEINGKCKDGHLCADRIENCSTEASEIAEFYKGKTLFITGAAGFLGTVLLESLLRCCPGIQKIYILLRTKKGVPPEKRKDALFKKDIFNIVKESDPKAPEKVVVISGDVTEENLGMSNSDLRRIVDEVSIVFHCAASISFFRPLIIAIAQNVIGTSNVIDLCRKLKKLEALVHTSTAFSNRKQDDPIEEKVYELPFAAEKIEKLVRQKKVEELNRLYSTLDPPFHNTYVFSKCVAENLVAEKASDLPVSIVRPSVISCTMKGALPGYIEEGSSAVALSLAIGHGYIHVMMTDNKNKFQLIPADIVANTLILAAFFQATQNLPSPYVYNCTTGDLVGYTSDDVTRKLLKMNQDYPLPNSYLTPWLILCKNPTTFRFFTLLLHYAPAVMIDLLLWICGRKPRYVKQYQFFDKCIEVTLPFWMDDWKFDIDHFKSLPEKLNDTDAEMFPVHLKDFTIEAMGENLRNGCPMYRVNNKPYREDPKITLLRKAVQFCVKWSFFGLVAFSVYHRVIWRNVSEDMER